MPTGSRHAAITTTHPRTKRQLKIAAEIYDPVKAAILQSLKGSKGKTFSELNEDVVMIMKKNRPGFKGSVPWYTISVRPDPETKGIAESFTEKGRKLNLLRKK